MTNKRQTQIPCGNDKKGSLAGGIIFFGSEFAGGGAVAEGLFIAFELVEGAGRFAGAACRRFTVGLFACEAAARFTGVASAGCAVGLLRAKTAAGLSGVAAAGSDGVA